MALETQDVVTIIEALNKTGGIPISITAQTDWMQFGITGLLTLLGVIFFFPYIWEVFIKPIAGKVYIAYAFSKLKRQTGRHFLVIKHTEIGLFGQSMITTGTLRKIEEALQGFKGEPFDLILHTPGGEIFATQLISRAIRAYKHPVRAIVPYYAMSGGTMLALSCSEIFMGRFAALGAVDPQLGGLFSFGSARSWQKVVDMKGKKANDSSIQFAFTGDQYTKTLKSQVKEVLADKIADPALLENTATYLTDGAIEHGLPLSRTDLVTLGIPVHEIDEESTKLFGKVLTNSMIEGVYYT